MHRLCRLRARAGRRGADEGHEGARALRAVRAALSRHRPHDDRASRAHPDDLADAHGLAPKDAPTLFWTIQLQLTVSDFVAEVHNVHHPVALDEYYKDQKAEAARNAKGFRDKRMPKFLGYFDRAAGAVEGDFVAGKQWSPIDTSLFQLIEGLRYAFPQRMAAIEGDYPRLVAVHDKVATLPGIAAYLKSDRRIAFNEDDIFRHYPELDAA